MQNRACFEYLFSSTQYAFCVTGFNFENCCCIKMTFASCPGCNANLFQQPNGWIAHISIIIITIIVIVHFYELQYTFIVSIEFHLYLQWISLIRSHAEVIVDDEVVLPIFKKFCKVCCSFSIGFLFLLLQNIPICKLSFFRDLFSLLL